MRFTIQDKSQIQELWLILVVYVYITVELKHTPGVATASDDVDVALELGYFPIQHMWVS